MITNKLGVEIDKIERAGMLFYTVVRGQYNINDIAHHERVQRVVQRLNKNISKRVN